MEGIYNISSFSSITNGSRVLPLLMRYGSLAFRTLLFVFICTLFTFQISFIQRLQRSLFPYTAFTFSFPFFNVVIVSNCTLFFVLNCKVLALPGQLYVRP